MGGDRAQGAAPDLSYSMILLNGEFYEGSVLSDSILLGDGVFETLRSYEGKLFRLESHLNRLNLGLRAIEVPLSNHPRLDRMNITGEVARLMKLNELAAGALRISAYADGNLIISHAPLRSPKESIRCMVLESQLESFAFKSSSYSARLAHRRYAERAGVDDVILVNARREVSELSTSNLILFSEGRWITPQIVSGALPGVTRQALVEHFGIEERPVSLETLRNAESLAAISSLREIQPIKEIDGKDTPISNRLRQLQDSFHSWILGNLSQ